MCNNKLGRPKLSLNQIETIVHKLEPYLKRGFSIRKACYLANIPHSTVYELVENNVDFSDNLEAFKQYKSVLLSDIFISELEEIHKKAMILTKLNYVLETKSLPKYLAEKIKHKKESYVLSKYDWDFLKWLAEQENQLRKGFNERLEAFDAQGFAVSAVLNKLEDNESSYYNLANAATLQLKHFGN